MEDGRIRGALRVGDGAVGCVIKLGQCDKFLLLFPNPWCLACVQPIKRVLEGVFVAATRKAEGV